MTTTLLSHGKVRISRQTAYTYANRAGVREWDMGRQLRRAGFSVSQSGFFFSAPDTSENRAVADIIDPGWLHAYGHIKGEPLP